ncbi:MAG: hypothetical protein Greene071421_220 [Parcubacteria group bacterium Greene0714_21]|nr:MAG: hypothetical protein Greene041639_315 [Parcubacteria group bacterium Greene0416_39]TSC97692.1 MAG: hypothetical protein Greene101447_329 [Parcubacteria group bacterium Greene1014_47]TSD04384.1 MAG: hypothetical protein Greene071421_220 [Parcubacteria group bacterium Greene0714_21]
MTIKELKTLLDQARGKIIVVEDEKPIMVITPYEEQSLSPMPQEKAGLTLDDLPL